MTKNIGTPFRDPLDEKQLEQKLLLKNEEFTYWYCNCRSTCINCRPFLKMLIFHLNLIHN